MAIRPLVSIDGCARLNARRCVASVLLPGRRTRRTSGVRLGWSGAREVGYPPRSYDWSPAAARAAGFPLDGMRKWEREHPRWPHHALVVTRLGHR